MRTHRRCILLCLVDCNGATGKVRVGWLLRLSQCIDEFYINSERHSDDVFAKMYDMPYISVLDKTDIRYMRQNVTEFDCTDAGSIDLKALALPPIVAAKVLLNYLFLLVFLHTLVTSLYMIRIFVSPCRHK